MSPDEYAAEAMMHAGMAAQLAAQAEREDSELSADLYDAWAEWHRLRHDYLLLLGAISAHREAAHDAMDPTGPPTFWQGDLSLWGIIDADDDWRGQFYDDQSEIVYDDEANRMVPPPEWPGWN